MVTSYYAAKRSWHPGELAIQRRLGYDEAMAGIWAAVDPFMPEQHQIFHATRLHFLPLAVLDDRGRPWTGIACGPDGQRGFVHVRNESSVRIDALTWPGDPLHEFQLDPGALVAGLGIEVSTRRRNKFAGHIMSSLRRDGGLLLDLNVDQALGNCPKYINVRNIAPPARTSAPTVEVLRRASPLSPAAIDLVHAADTFFLATTFASSDGTSHLGQNHRGGLPGFVRVLHGSTVVVPDFSGNRFMQSLGNIEASSLAGLAVPDFVTGDVLYLTGSARTLVGETAQKIMPRQSVVTLIDVQEWTLVRDALPVRQVPGTAVERSPYSPPVKYLAEDIVQKGEVSLSGVKLLLSSIDLHSEHDATFTFHVESSGKEKVDVRPGQAAIVDLSSLFGRNAYRHMAQTGAEKTLNDDGIRTWTISRFEPSSATDTSALLSLTIREKVDGSMTPKLLGLARRLASVRPELLTDTRPLDIRLDLVGVVGSFVLPEIVGKDGILSTGRPSRRLLWLAGGIGITPFLAMLRAIVSGSGNTDQPWDILLVVADKDVNIPLTLVSSVMATLPTSTLSSESALLRLRVYALSSQSPVTSTPALPPSVEIHQREGRLRETFFTDEGLRGDMSARSVFLCGGPGFERTAMNALAAVGIGAGDVRREGFNY
ncbi:hypothetical protein EXIGLDRAFT_614631 [Exidia glandulosa HHB12029]|uniref:FAD-binding FR-type domain-containing protein n=1 Tax=Exidia glandulosa HHB12029 TaxID=1314781 RepID=A0A165HPP7_EXIGL|nr:hypothetical protein EXIGLDRAFT_614631 [Exidia glandulosa HHB12029]